MSRLPTPGGDDNQWGTILNDFLGQSHNSDGTLKGASVASAGAEMTANKGQVNGYASLDSSGKVPSAQLPNGGIPDATTTSKGIVQLAGDLAGTAASPTVPGLATKLTASNNLSDLNSLSAARTNLGLGGAAVLDVGTTTGTVAAGDDTRLTGAIQSSTVTAKGDILAATGSSAVVRVGVGSNGTVLTADGTQSAGVRWASITASGLGALVAANNLSDLSNPGTARTNLGLGGAATLNVGTTAGTVAAGDDSRFSSAQSRLVPTAVKTSNYTAAVGDFVPTDTSGGSVTITLPTAPADGSRIGIKMIAVAGSNTTTINTGGSDVFNKTGGSTSGTLTLLNQSMSLQYYAAGGIWYVLADDLPLSQTDARYVAKSLVTTKGDIVTASAASTPARLAVGSTGQFLKPDSTQTSGLRWTYDPGVVMVMAAKFR